MTLIAPTPARLFHYTCQHGADRIRRDKCVRTFPNPLLGGLKLAWFTDLDVPIAEALGLTSIDLSCDRTEIRFEIEIGWPMAWWPKYRRDVLSHLDLHAEIALLERQRPGLMPAHWWVSWMPIPILESAERTAS